MSTPRKPWVYHLFFWITLAFFLALVFHLLQPFLDAIFIAIILASLVHPLQSRLIRLLRGRRTLAALLMTAMVTLVIIVPLFLAGLAVISEGVDEVRKLDEWLGTERWEELADQPVVRDSLNWARDTLQAMGSDMESAKERLLVNGQSVATSIIQKGAGFIGNLTGLLSRFPLMLFVLFFLLRDGERYAAQAKDLLPLHEDQKNSLFLRAGDMFRAVFVGTLLTALLQGVIGGAGLALAGFSPFLGGALVGLSSFIPILGTGLVFIPLTLWLLFSGDYGNALLLAAWAMLFVAPIDNYVRPFLMPERAHLSALYLFLAIIGGLFAFGLPGIVYGPLIFGLSAVMLENYSNEYLQDNAASA